MNSISLILNRPKLKNLFNGVFFAFVGCLNIIAVILIITAAPPIHFWDKLFNVAGFCSMLIMALFMGFSVFNAIRNVFSPPTVVLDNYKLKIYAEKNILLKDIANTVLLKEKNHVSLKIVQKNGEETDIRQDLISIPLNTLEYAIHIRLNQINKN